MTERYNRGPTNRQLGKFLAICLGIGVLVGVSTEVNDHVDAERNVAVAVACVDADSNGGRLTQKAIECVGSQTPISLESLEPGSPSTSAVAYIRGEQSEYTGFDVSQPLTDGLKGGGIGIGLIVVGAFLGAFDPRKT